MKIAIDINDVVRDYSNNFVRYYIEGYNREFDLSNFEFWTNDMQALFPFNSKNSYFNFVYNDYAFELYGKCPTATRNLSSELNDLFFYFLKVREVYFPQDSSTIWDKCDVLITANPALLDTKPEGKVSIKIKAEYNEDSDADYTFKDLSSFISDEKNITKLIDETIES